MEFMSRITVCVCVCVCVCDGIYEYTDRASVYTPFLKLLTRSQSH